jgi:hypothetical protein
LELLQIEQWPQTHTPQNRKDIHGNEVGVCDCANLAQNVERRHCHSWLFGFYCSYEWNNLLLHRILVESGWRACLFSVRHDPIKTIIAPSWVIRAATEYHKRFKASHLDPETACLREYRSDDWEELILYRREVQHR